MKSMSTVTITTPNDRDVVITREFDAPRSLVFEALTRPELIRKWMKAPGRSLEICDVDLRVGGAYHFVWKGPGRRDVGMYGVYREVAPPERLVVTESWEDWDAGETMSTTVLVERAGKTILTNTAHFPSRDVRDTVLKSGLESGAAENYNLLAAALRDLAAHRPSN